MIECGIMQRDPSRWLGVPDSVSAAGAECVEADSEIRVGWKCGWIEEMQGGIWGLRLGWSLLRRITRF